MENIFIRLFILGQVLNQGSFGGALTRSHLRSFDFNGYTSRKELSGGMFEDINPSNSYDYGSLEESTVEKDIKVQNYKNIGVVDEQIELDDKTVHSEPDHESFKLDETVTKALSRSVWSPRFEFPGGIDNPETFSAGTSPQAQVFQTPVGGRCFLPFRENITEGVCQAAENCPHFQPLFKQIQYEGTIQFLAVHQCHFNGEQVFFCCPPPTNSAVELPNIVSLSPTSPVPAPIPGPSDCGKVIVRPGRIVGGENITEGEFPWLAVIGDPEGFTEFQAFCSGSLITRRHVMTAAHCFRLPSLIYPTRVRVGELDLESNFETQHQEFIIIGIHAPLYYEYNAINDVALVTLSGDVQFNDFVQPACLPFSAPELPAAGETLVAVGYGAIEVNLTARIVEFSPYPRRVDLPVLDNAACQAAFYSSPVIFIIDDRVICTGGVQGESKCFGDSGGPLHYRDEESDKYIVVGVANAGAVECGTDQVPSIDLRVGAFLPWIQSVVGERSQLQ